MTEPAGGANIEDTSQQGRTIRTVAALEGNEWVISGQKIWPSGAGISEVYVTVCSVDPDLGEDGIVLICVPKDVAGLSFGKAEEKMGLIYTDKNRAVYYENVRVPQAYCCGRPGGEGAVILREMISGRISESAMAVGAAQAALEIAVDYTRDRTIRSKAVRDRSQHAGLLGEMAAKLQVARSDYLHVASMLDRPAAHGPLHSPPQLARVSASKLISTRLALEVIHSAIELMGSYGYCPDYHVEKYLRDAVIVRLTMGGPQLCALEAARGQYPLNLW
jgi:alkylation response protein AidB-like acyl-CoA dehydrogenase